MNVLSNLMSPTISPAGSQQRSPPNTGNEGSAVPPETTQSFGGTISPDARDQLMAGATELKGAGASTGEIKSFVDSTLEANGVDFTGGNNRSGQLLDIMT